jgi:uncharacterized protein YqhQ
MEDNVNQDRTTHDLPVGGQAVIEGVMMRAQGKIVTAVRSGDGIIVKSDDHVAWAERLNCLRIPIVRGAVAFFEMLVIGLKSLNFSADMALANEGTADALEQRQSQPKWQATMVLTATIVFSLAVGIGVFFFLPLLAAQTIGVERDAFLFNLIAGGIRATLLVGYMWLISRWSEIGRVFEYHGAEHKSIFTFEAGVDLTVEEARSFGRLHPRCGTSFLLIVVLLSIFLFAVADSMFADFVARQQTLLERFATHVSVLPLVSGLSFEMLKLSGRKRNHPLTRLLIAPGLWLQRITTREPSDDQLQVALVALLHALGKPSPIAYSLYDETGGLESMTAVPASGGGGGGGAG